LASAGFLTDDAGLEIQVHRRVSPEQAARASLIEQIHGLEGSHMAPAAPVVIPGQQAAIDVMSEPVVAAPTPQGGVEMIPLGVGGPQVRPDPTQIVRIPLRGHAPMPLDRGDVVLNPGDVVVVPSRLSDVFYVVGKLSPTNFVKFSVGVRERDLGTGFLLPRERDVDVVTAVAMAGYIDPIDSPTTVTVHRTGPDGQPLLILVDLIKARYDRQESILVQAGDIIYLNPDGAWWGRRTFDRILPDLFVQPYRHLFNGSDNGN
jgi:hypothetical protein